MQKNRVLENIFSYIHTARPEIMDILSEQQNQYLTSTKRQTSMQEKKMNDPVDCVLRHPQGGNHSGRFVSLPLIRIRILLAHNFKYSASSLFSSVLHDRGRSLPIFCSVNQSHQSSVEGNQFRALSNPFPCQDFLTSQDFPTYISVYNT